jgi:hypothetical protein
MEESMPNLLSVFKRKSNETPKYYIYVSETKVDMLVPQIPASVLRSLEAEIKVNVAAFVVGVKKPSSAPSPELTAKTKVISDYLEKQEGWVGTVANPLRYVKGVASLQYGRIGADYGIGIAFFGGEVDGVKLGLIGSPESLIGVADSEATNHSLDYYRLSFLNSVTEEEPEEPSDPDPDYEDAVYRDFLNSLPEDVTEPPDRAAFFADKHRREGQNYEDAVEQTLRPGVLPHQNRLEFLAKTVFHEEGLLVATPIYIALAD